VRLGIEVKGTVTRALAPSVPTHPGDTAAKPIGRKLCELVDDEYVHGIREVVGITIVQSISFSSRIKA
jgi:hypothetical protein